ncbi:MAG: hypothetical protein IKA64_01880 [Clostridia bacterium]|nr:hypothetical protein [Clostridia bacterium]
MFKLLKIENGRINVPEPIAFTAGVAFKSGTALKLSGGKLALADGAPEYIALSDGVADTEATVYRVTPDMVFEAPVSASPEALTEGDRVTLSEDATKLTATTSNGVATIINKNGAEAVGDKLVVIFA